MTDRLFISIDIYNHAHAKTHAHAKEILNTMKIYSKIVFDKYDNLIESESKEYSGPVSMCGGGSNPPPPPPPPYVAPSPTTYKSEGRALRSASGGRGVLIEQGQPLGIAPGQADLGVARKNLLQGQQELSVNFLRLLGGGY